MVRALLVDDEQPARERLRRLLAAFDEVEVVGEAEDGEHAFAVVADCERAEGQLRPVFFSIASNEIAS